MTWSHRQAKPMRWRLPVQQKSKTETVAFLLMGVLKVADG